MYLHEKLSIFIKSPDFNEITDFSGFSKETLIPFAVSSQKIAYFQKIDRFSRDFLLDIKGDTYFW